MLRFFRRRPDLATAFAQLQQRGVSRELTAALAEFYTHADDRELYHLNPRVPAERMQLGLRATLRVLIEALYVGLVDLHWDVRCPVCGAVDPRKRNLNELQHDHVCEICTARFAARIDDEVRVTFSLHERLRGRPLVDDQAFRNEVDARLKPVSGHELLLLPDFQRLFPTQRLVPDESLDVTRVALVFTDLAGSTLIYARRGDPRAYSLVRLHFEELFRIADTCQGIMVKTIGDAVMAAFLTPAEALRAGLAMQEAIATLNRDNALEGDERLILKVGLHSGPCLSVTLNERPDYFGTTVNIAARVEGLSTGNDVVFTDAIRNDPEAAKLIGDRTLESGNVRLKGIEDEVHVHRLRL
jgi:class 3 adenylate cyclase